MISSDDIFNRFQELAIPSGPRGYGAKYVNGKLEYTGEITESSEIKTTTHEDIDDFIKSTNPDFYTVWSVFRKL